MGLRVLTVMLFWSAVDISDRLPYNAVKSSSSKVWIKFARHISTCSSASEVLLQALWFYRQVRVSIFS